MAARQTESGGSQLANRDLIIYADRDSRSARALARALGCRRWYENSSPGRKTASVVPVIVNWGATNPPNWIRRPGWPWPNAPKFNLLNSMPHVATGVDKLLTFTALAQNNVAERLAHSQSRDQAQEWLQEDERVIVRQTTRGSSGAGLRVVTEGQVPRAPLYTRYYAKTHEFRVHVFKGQVIDFVQKKLRPEFVERPDTDRIVRNLENGWVYAHDGLIASQADKEQIGAACVRACSALGLDFGAVDVLAQYGQPRRDNSRRLKDFRICEVNTAPGLENTATINAYARAISNHYREVKGRHALLSSRTRL